MRDVLWPGVVAGAGLAGTLDEVVFHQLLEWHHFATAAPLPSDGLLHLATAVALVVGTALMVRALPWTRRRAVGAVVTGAGGFNVFDGVVDHKVLRLHQVRDGVEDLLPYDVAWIGLSALVLLAGLLVLRGTAPAVRRS